MSRRKEGGLGAILRDQVREDLLKAAEEVFAQEGLQAAKIGDVAKRAGVAVGTVYNYFEDRDALVKALLDARCASIGTRLGAAMANEGPFVEQLRAVVGTMLATMHENWRFVTLMMQSEMLSRMPGAKGKPVTGVLARQTLAQLSALMERGIAAGVLAPGPTRLYGMLLMALVRSVVLAPHMGADDLGDVSAEQLVALFLRGAGAAGGGAGPA